MFSCKLAIHINILRWMDACMQGLHRAVRSDSCGGGGGAGAPDQSKHALRFKSNIVTA